jgi:hypothetical protein
MGAMVSPMADRNLVSAIFIPTSFVPSLFGWTPQGLLGPLADVVMTSVTA